MSNSNPSIDPSNLGTVTGLFRHVFNKLLQSVDGVLPAKVIAYDGKYVQVQPLIAVMGTDGSLTPRGQIAKIPVVKFGGGGFIFNIPLNPGDLGIIVASDRDISLFLQSNNESAPNTFRIKNFADSYFIPTVLNNYEIDEEDLSNAVVQKTDGTVKISLSADTVKITAPNVIVETEEATINASSKIIMNTPLLGVDGQIIATGNITPNTPIPP